MSQTSRHLIAQTSHYLINTTGQKEGSSRALQSGKEKRKNTPRWRFSGESRFAESRRRKQKIEIRCSQGPKEGGVCVRVSVVPRPRPSPEHSNPPISFSHSQVRHRLAREHHYCQDSFGRSSAKILTRVLIFNLFFRLEQHLYLPMYLSTQVPKCLHLQIAIVRNTFHLSGTKFCVYVTIASQILTSFLR